MFHKCITALKRKLNNHDGDSIAEVLVALLISSLALVMLASMITTSSRMIAASRTKMQDYYEESSSLTSPDGASADVKISSAQLQIPGGTPQMYTVKYYKSSEFPQVVSFQKG